MNETMTETARASIETLRDDIAMLRTDVTDMFKNLAESGYQSVRDTASQAGERAGDYAAAARDKVSEAHEKLAECAGTRPLTYLALAFAAGAVASKLLSSRR